MPVIFQALPVQLFLKFMLHDGRPCDIFFVAVHLRPLERRKWFWDKEGGTGGNLAFPVSLFLRNLVVPSGNLVGKTRDLLHILLRLGGKPQHKIELDLIPAACKCLSCAVQNNFLGQSFVDYIPHPLGTCLRCECQAALAYILHLAHDVQ